MEKKSITVNNMVCIMLVLLSLSSCASKRLQSITYLGRNNVRVAADTTSISSIIDGALIKTPINTIQREALYCPLLISITQSEFASDHSWYKRMTPFVDKYLKGNSTMLFSISGYMISFLVESNLMSCVELPILCEYTGVDYYEWNPYYLNFTGNNQDDILPHKVYRSVKDLKRSDQMLLIDRKFLSKDKTIVNLYLIHSSTRGVDLECFKNHNCIVYTPKSGIFSPYRDRFETYQTISRVFDPILDKTIINKIP